MSALDSDGLGEPWRGEESEPRRARLAVVYHQDGSVTIWDVYSQGWRRLYRPSNEVLASLSPEERAGVVRHTARWRDVVPGSPS